MMSTDHGSYLVAALNGLADTHHCIVLRPAHEFLRTLHFGPRSLHDQDSCQEVL